MGAGCFWMRQPQYELGILLAFALLHPRGLGLSLRIRHEEEQGFLLAHYARSYCDHQSLSLSGPVSGHLGEDARIRAIVGW